MKKYLIVLAAALVALAGCKETENKYTSIKFKYAELTMKVGATDKLQVLYEPTTLEAPKCEWSSSNTDIVSVDQNGNIKALAIGDANIVAKYKEGDSELNAACKVTVKDPLESVKWGGFGLFNLNKKMILSNDTVIATLQNGRKVSCVMIPALYYVWDDGIFMDEEGALHGEGYMIQAEGTCLLITDALDENGKNYYYLGTAALRFIDPATYNPHDTAFAYCCPAGKITGTAAEHMAWLQDTTGTVEPAFTGTLISAFDVDNSERLNMMSGLAGTGIFVGDESSVQYKFNAQWFDGESLYGLVMELDDEGNMVDFKKPYEWAPLTNIYYEYVAESEEEAPRYKAQEFVAPKQDLRKLFNPKDVLVKK
ncbi:MAG: Ig-like domain-containing protein [Paludibacteraceae bacterium]|nr:Ig-like domain-containing protein [Paludibacteraceae bacterium]